MHPKQVDRSSKRRIAPASAPPGGALELDSARTERIATLEGALEQASEATLRAAFDRFFDTWFDRVYAFARRTGRDDAYAESLTTLIFMKALRLLPRGAKGRRGLARRPGPESGEPDAASVRPDRVAPGRRGRAN